MTPAEQAERMQAVLAERLASDVMDVLDEEIARFNALPVSAGLCTLGVFQVKAGVAEIDAVAIDQHATLNVKLWLQFDDKDDSRRIDASKGRMNFSFRVGEVRSAIRNEILFELSCSTEYIAEEYSEPVNS